MNLTSKRVFRIATICTSLLVGLVLLVILLLQWRADSIAQRLLDGANAEFPGEFELDEAELRLLRYLPNITLQLSGVHFRERKGDPDSEILAVDRMLVAINPFKLIANEIKLTALELYGGYISLVQYQDFTSNITRALGAIASADSGKVVEPGQESARSPLKMEIKNLRISNVQFEVSDHISGYYLGSTLEILEDQLVYNEQEIDNQLYLSLYLDEFSDSTQVRLAGQRVELEADMFLDRNTRVASFSECLLSLNGAGISLTGTYDLANQGDANLTFHSENAHLNLFSMLTNQVLLLPEERVELNGEIDLNGEIKGRTLGDQLPFVRVNFSSNNISMYDKGTNAFLLRDMDSRIFFTTGHAADLSEFNLRLDTLNVEFPDGFIQGKAALNNLTRPQLNLQLLADNNMATIQKLLNPEHVAGLRGRLKTDIDIDIKLDPESGKYDRNFGTSSIQWANGAFHLPAQELRADLIDVTLVGESNSFEITNFDLVRASSDFTLSGSLDNAITYLLKDPNDLEGELSLATTKLRLYDFIDSTLIPGVSPEFYNLKTRITLTAPHEARWQGKRFLSGAILTLEHFETESNVSAPIRDISGSVSADRRQINLDNWVGILGESDVRFDLRLSARRNLFNKYIKLHDLRLDYDFSSSTIRAADFFTFMDHFYLPEAYRSEVLKGFRLKGYVEAERPDSVEYARIPDLHFLIEDMRFQLTSYSVPLTDFRIDVLKNERNAELAALEGRIGNSDFRLTGELINFFTPPNESPRQLTGRLRVSASRLSAADFTNASEVLAFTPEIYDLATEMRLFVPADVRAGSGGLAGAYVELSDFNTRSNFIADIKKIKGRMAFEPGGVLLENWEGQLGQSGVSMDIALHGLLRAMSESPPARSITLDYHVSSERIRAADLFTLRDSFYLPTQFQNEEMRDLRLSGQISAIGKIGEPESSLQLNIDELEWEFTQFPIAFRDFNVDMTMQPHRATLNIFTGKIGRSDFTLQGRAANMSAFTGLSNATPELELAITSGHLDLTELVELYLPTLQQAVATGSSRNGNMDPAPIAETRLDSANINDFNILALPIPEGQLDLRIDTVRFQQSIFQGIQGTLGTSSARKITLENLQAIVAGGRAGLSGGLDLSNPDSAQLEVVVAIQDADFDRLTNPIMYGGEYFVPADHFRGILNTRAEISTRLLPDLGLDVTGANGNISLSLENGEILDFAPLQMLSSFMGSKDLKQVRFDDLQNELELENGYLFVPKMDVNSTLGAIRMTGFQYFDSEMEYLVQIPLSLVTSVGWNTLTGKSRKEDAAPDEIIKMNDGGICVNIRLEGTMDDYNIKLGKGETFKAIDKEAKKHARREKKNKRAKE